MSPDPTPPTIAKPPTTAPQPQAPTVPPTTGPAPQPGVAPHLGPAFGVQPEQLEAITRQWHQAGSDIDKYAWSFLSEAAGEGSDVFAAVRDCPDPAKQAMNSIATRFSTMADLVDRFRINVIEKDAEIAGEIGKLSPRG
ncbi:hypothetical protein [Nocardia sp. NPDC052566]|uniref:hypothetical protein n=1 Tax=Nocardia sp. NPDC052566 TaxID=3364330 RepID=UPI0037C73B29